MGFFNTLLEIGESILNNPIEQQERTLKDAERKISKAENRSDDMSGPQLEKIKRAR